MNRSLLGSDNLSAEQIISDEIKNRFGWCGTCNDNASESNGHCKHYESFRLLTNNMTDQEELDYLKEVVKRNNQSFSNPSINENWGFCSENCLNLNVQQEFSEVCTFLLIKVI